MNKWLNNSLDGFAKHELLPKDETLELVHVMHEGLNPQAFEEVYNELKQQFKEERSRLPLDWGAQEEAYRLTSSPEAVVAHDRLLEHNYRLILWRSRHISNYTEERHDDMDEIFANALSSASLGIWRYSPDSQHSLGTHIVKNVDWGRVKQDSRRFTMVELPEYLHRNVIKIRRYYTDVAQEDNYQDLNVDTMASDLDMSRDLIKRALGVIDRFWNMQSIDGERSATEYFDLDGQPTLRLGMSDRTELIESDWEERMHEEIENMLLADALDEALVGLPDRTETILRLRYRVGSENEEKMTLEEVGDIYGVTKERIRQIEVKGLDLLRLSPEGKKLRHFLTEGTEEDGMPSDIRKTRVKKNVELGDDDVSRSFTWLANHEADFHAWGNFMEESAAAKRPENDRIWRHCLQVAAKSIFGYDTTRKHGRVSPEQVVLPPDTSRTDIRERLVSFADELYSLEFRTVVLHERLHQSTDQERELMNKEIETAKQKIAELIDYETAKHKR